MTKRWLLFVCAAAVLGLVGTAPALAAQPYPLNYKTFAFSASDSTRSGTVLSGGSLVLGSSGLGVAHLRRPVRQLLRRRRRRLRGLRLRDLDLRGHQSVVRVQRARLVVEREHAVGHLGAGRGAAAARRRPLGQVVHPRPLVVRRLLVPPHLGRRPGRRRRLRLDRHLLREGPSGDRLPPAGDALPEGRAPRPARRSAG